jgi:hypothetical protein
MSQPDTSGCWIWIGPASNRGYAQMTVQDADESKPRTVSAHRVSYETFIGPIPEGLVIDHLCRNRMCVNPEHLEPVTQRENTMRSPVAVGALNAAKTHCAQGHEYTEANTYVYVMKSPRSCTTRICRTCRKEWRRRSRKGKVA